MAKGTFNNVHIGGLCVALPSKAVATNAVAHGMDDKAIKRFIRSTGVEKRYLSCLNQTTADLCYVAARELLTQKNIDKSEIDAMIFVTQNPDYKRPSTAIILQERLGLPHSCMAFDINLGCSGYVYGLYTLASMIEGNGIRKALLLTGDVNKDLSNELLFGDGASATLIEAGGDMIDGIMKSDGSGYRAIYTPTGGQRNPIVSMEDLENAVPKMNGTDVFEFTIKQVPALFEEYKITFGKKLEQFDYIIMHQANLMMLKHIANKLNIPAEKMPISIHKYGNVSSASVPIAIADLCENLEVPKQELELLISGFGVGLSLGILSIKLQPKDVLPIVYSDYVWDEKFDEVCSE